MLTVTLDPNVDGDGDETTFGGAPATLLGLVNLSYRVNGNQLIRNAGSDQVLADDITNINFLYLLEGAVDVAAGDGVANPTPGQMDDIVAVQVTLTGQANTIGGLKTRNLASRVWLRNL